MTAGRYLSKSMTRAAVLLGVLLTITAQAHAETVVALPGAECKEVRATLELYVPIAPGFRQLEMPFPENDEKIQGSLCRLVAVGTGVHVENERIRTLQDMQGYVKGALVEAGWTSTAQTERFKGKSKHGRHVFALTRNNAICVTTIQVGMVPGVETPRGAMEDGTIYLGSLKPHQREWWIAVDCFHF